MLDPIVDTSCILESNGLFEAPFARSKVGYRNVEIKLWTMGATLPSGWIDRSSTLQTRSVQVQAELTKEPEFSLDRVHLQGLHETDHGRTKGVGKD